MQKPLEMHSHLTCSKALKTMVVVEREEAKGRRESTKTCFLNEFLTTDSETMTGKISL